MESRLLEQKIFSIGSPVDFETAALEVFRFQYRSNRIYRDYVNILGINPVQVISVSEIPFLPIAFFKTHRMIADGLSEEKIFESSGTTGVIPSRHFVADIKLYEQSFLQGFEYFYGDVSQYCIFGLLPSYLERESSSLVYMVDLLMKKGDPEFGGFYLHDFGLLATHLQQAAAQNKKILLFGVTFALLDMAETFKIKIPDALIFETGGMKGRKEELIREKLHKTLCKGFGVEKIHSEYGMTELLSQAYSNGDGIFNCPPWMQVRMRDTNDPLSWIETGQTGGINVIDLANLYSCSFIATQDLGKKQDDGSFEVLGRFDHSDVRGCSLLTTN